MQTPYSRPTEDDLLDRTIKKRVATATPPKAVAIFGPRRIGKTTLLEQITQGQQTSWYVGEFPGTAEALSFRTPGDVVNLLTAAPNLVIDEAHKIADIGIIVKMLVETNVLTNHAASFWRALRQFICKRSKRRLSAV